MRKSLLIFVNGQQHVVIGAAAFRSLSDYLRYDLGLAGTKVVCAEGDCGSCTVFLGRLRVDDDRIEYTTVCSCIQFMHQLDGTHVVTIEGLTPAVGLNPIQQAMLTCHGAQCGFCTPGIVVSMQAVFESVTASSVTARDLKRGLVGNLCRCTGYQSILDAGTGVDVKSVSRIEDLFPSETMVDLMRQCAIESVSVIDGDRTHVAPVTLTEAIAFREAHPDCTILAGGSDIGVLVNKGLREPKSILNLSGLGELRSLSEDADGIHAGALVSLTEIENIAERLIPEYAHFLQYFGSPPIKNAATIGGNIANGSPIGDSMPPLFVFEAEIELAGPQGRRRVNINQFYTGYRRTVMTGGELIVAVHIPVPKPDETVKLYKVSRRKDLDISAFSAAFRMNVNGGRITNCRIALGGVAATIVRLSSVETFLTDAPLNRETFVEAGRLARGEIKPLSDVRGSADYRLQLAENIFRRLFADIDPSSKSTPFPRLPSDNGHANHNGNGHTLTVGGI